MTSAISQREYEAIVSAINKQPHDRMVFKRGVSRINMGSAIRPSGMSENRFPGALTDWRRNPEASKKHLDLHVEACERAFQAYWDVMKESDFV